jgi:hypothetical protein
MKENVNSKISRNELVGELDTEINPFKVQAESLRRVM